MKFTKIPEATFEQVQLNSGVILSAFEPSAGTMELTNIVGATSGGTSFSLIPQFKDAGEGIDNCPKNTKELKKIDYYESKMSGSFVTMTANQAKMMAAAADVSGDKITPRTDLKDTDFADLWWVGDYSDKNGETNGGFIAIHMKNSLSTGGFSIQSSEDKGQFAFEFMAHYSIKAQTEVPVEIFVHKGTEEA